MHNGGEGKGGDGKGRERRKEMKKGDNGGEEKGGWVGKVRGESRVGNLY